MQALYKLYKACANMIAFSTLQERLVTWIKAFYFHYYLGLMFVMFDGANKKNKSMLDTLVGARCAFGPPK
jgi:hypothetical protein